MEMKLTITCQKRVESEEPAPGEELYWWDYSDMKIALDDDDECVYITFGYDDVYRIEINDFLKVSRLLDMLV